MDKGGVPLPGERWRRRQLDKAQHIFGALNKHRGKRLVPTEGKIRSLVFLHLGVDAGLSRP